MWRGLPRAEMEPLWAWTALQIDTRMFQRPGYSWAWARWGLNSETSCRVPGLVLTN